METGLNAFKEALHLKHVEAGEYSPLALAYIGDAVYELAFLSASGGRTDGCGEGGIPTRTQCEIFYDAEARDDEGLPDGDRI